MAELSKKDIAEVFVEQFEPFAQAIHKDFDQVNMRLDKVEQDVAEVKADVNHLKQDVAEVKADVNHLKQDVAEVKADVQWTKETLDDLVTTIDRLMHFYEKQEQEMLALGEQVRRLESRVAKLELEKSGSQA